MPIFSDIKNTTYLTVDGIFIKSDSVIFEIYLCMFLYQMC